MISAKENSKYDTIDLSIISKNNCTLHIKREDLIHPLISGNKYRKLKYNLIEAKTRNKTTLVTFGGAYSNHIAAVAAAGNQFNFKTIGVIRGEELSNTVLNPTLQFAKQQGMDFHFISRTQYRNKTQAKFITTLKKTIGDFYLIPEGGTNNLAVKGCEEILSETDKKFDYVCTAVGTGGTIAGLVKDSNQNQRIIGFSALKGSFQTSEVVKYTSKKNYFITDKYCFGGYAKITEELISFINTFKQQAGIPLDPVYTGKMLFGIFDMLKNNYFPENSRILAIHTGGLQGRQGMNDFIKKKRVSNTKFPLIDI